MPSEINQEYCNNCQYPVSHESKYCSHCGQKHTDGRITVKKLFSDFFEIVFNIDNKIFRSIGALVIPGKLTTEYFSGRIKRYFHPIRMFFVLGIIFLLTMGSYTQQVEDLISNQLVANTAQSYGYLLAIEEADSLLNIWKDCYSYLDSQIVADKMMAGLRASDHHLEDSIDMQEFISVFGEGAVTLARKDIYEMPLDTIYKVYEVESFRDKLVLKQQIRFMKSGSKYISFIASNSIWAIILFMPFLALMLKLLYIRRKQYYVEHLIFSFHIHSFIFLLLILTILLLNWTGQEIWFVALALFVLYFFIALKRVYKQSWWKTIIKGCLVSLFYLMFSGLFMFVVFLFSFFIF